MRTCSSWLELRCGASTSVTDRCGGVDVAMIIAAELGSAREAMSAKEESAVVGGACTGEGGGGEVLWMVVGRYMK